MSAPRPTLLPRLALSRAQFATAEPALAAEWLVTNGLGGFAAGTVAQANTRRYHGLLVAALRPPLERTLLVAKLEAVATYRGRSVALGANEFADGTLAPRGFEQLAAFELDGSMPVWTWALADARLEQRIWMEHGANVTHVRFEMRHGGEPLALEVLPLCTGRDYHAHGLAHGGLRADARPAGCRMLFADGAPAYTIDSDRGRFEPDAAWYWGFRHRVESERGLDAVEDLLRPGRFLVSLAPGESVTFTLSSEASITRAGAVEPPPAQHARVSQAQSSSDLALERERRRQAALLDRNAAAVPGWLQRLHLAADAFIVARAAAADASPAGRSVIAGYPWFGDWGRDTMIALPGLALATGRSEIAAAILRTFAAHVSEGMLPNRFPDRGEEPEYNTVDATLWYFEAIAAYLEAIADDALLRELYPVLADILDWHRRGTRHGIGVDPADGLLRAGEPGVQLTWMDAKIGDWVVTPRTGKAVEINALWHRALQHMAAWAARCGDPQGAARCELEAARVAQSFASRFWFAQGAHLYDVVDGPSGSADASGRRADATLRPNQLLAVSLGGGLLDAPRARAVVDACARELLTPVGLRSLAPTSPDYAGRYVGGPRERDAVYHQGTVWSWLLGPFALAHYRAYGDAAQARTFLAGIAPHLAEGGLGTISEIFDGDAPHAPRGCFAQAWSVATILESWRALDRLESRRNRTERNHHVAQHG